MRIIRGSPQLEDISPDISPSLLLPPFLCGTATVAGLLPFGGGRSSAVEALDSSRRGELHDSSFAKRGGGDGWHRWTAAAVVGHEYGPS